MRKKRALPSRRRNSKNSTIDDIIDWVDESPHAEEEDGAPVIWVHDFSEHSARDFAKDLRKHEENKQVTTIIVRVDSYGGEIYSLLSMLEAMEACEKPIYTVCSGKAMSAGAVLLSAGDRRYVGKYSTIMIHQANGGTDGSAAEVQSDAKELDRLQDIVLAILAKNCGTTKQAIKNLIKEHAGADIFLTAKQALGQSNIGSTKLSLADHIGIPKLRRTVRWEIENDEEDEEDEG